MAPLASSPQRACWRGRPGWREAGRRAAGRGSRELWSGPYRLRAVLPTRIAQCRIPRWQAAGNGHAEQVHSMFPDAPAAGGNRSRRDGGVDGAEAERPSASRAKPCVGCRLMGTKRMKGTWATRGSRGTVGCNRPRGRIAPLGRSQTCRFSHSIFSPARRRPSNWRCRHICAVQRRMLRSRVSVRSGPGETTRMASPRHSSQGRATRGSASNIRDGR